MSISSNLTKLTTDITSAYTSIENKGGTIPANKNTNNLSTAIDSIEVIESATAEGESLSLANTKAMPYSDYVVKGKSEQETGKSLNIFKTIPNQTIQDVVLTKNSDGSYNLNGLATDHGNFELAGQTLEAGTYTLQCKYDGTLPSNEVPRVQIYSAGASLDVRIYSTDSNTYVQTFTLANTATDIRFRVRVMSGFNYQNLKLYPLLVSGTYTSQTIPDYEPYGEKPSPSIPSDIHSVADDVNLLNTSLATMKANNTNGTWNGNIYTNVGLTIEVKEDLSLVVNGTATAQQTFLLCNNQLFKANNYTINGINAINENARLYIWDSSWNNVTSALNYSNFTLSADTQIKVGLNLYNNKVYNNFEVKTKIIKGIDITPYSPYNQGTVTIKQRGKNLCSNLSSDYIIGTETYGYRKIIDVFSKRFLKILLIDNDTSVNISGVYFGFSTQGKNATGGVYWIINNGTTEQSIVTTEYTYISFYPNNIETFNKIFARFKVMLIETDNYSENPNYEPYQGYDKVLQTEPLRSLPNGVKDTIEAEQHRKIGKQTGTLTETTTITLSDAKTNGAYMCNIKPSGTLTGKTIELEAGDYEIIYELEEEIIEPLTQNQATTMLDIIKTGSYEGTTNIYTDEDVKPTIGVDYYKKG